MTEYQCQSCNFRFNAHKKPLRCPYCGKAGVVGDIPSATDIMMDVENIEQNAIQRTKRE